MQPEGLPEAVSHRLAALDSAEPVRPAGDLLDANPGDAAHHFAFDADHGVGDALDHRAFLGVVEHALDQLNIHERHLVLLDCLAGFDARRLANPYRDA